MGRELPPGRRVGNYAVEHLLAKGGLWSSYAARQSRTERPCELTVFHLDPDTDPWGQFRRELEQVSSLQHPCMVEVLDLSVSHDGTPYLVTESCSGEDLARRLREKGALTLAEALAVARQIGAALHAGHGIGVLHRDVRPENILLLGPPSASAEAGAPSFERIKLKGFGIARLLDATVSGMALVGNPEYMAPEQILRHALEVDPRADQYALGVVLYQSLSTARPFRGDSVGATLVQVTRGTAEPLRALRPDIPPHVEAAIARAMSKDPEARYPDSLTFLQAVQEGVPLPIGMAELTEPWLSPPPDLEEAARRVREAGAAPAAPLSLGVSAALAQGVRHLGTDEPAVPQPVGEAPTMPVSMEEVMKLAVPPPARPETSGPRPQSGGVVEAVPIEASSDQVIEIISTPPAAVVTEESAPIEIIAEYTDDGRPIPQVGERELAARTSEPQPILPSVIIDLPTRPLADADRRTAILQTAGKPPPPPSPSHSRWQALVHRLDTRAPLYERIAWALAGASLGTLLTYFLT